MIKRRQLLAKTAAIAGSALLLPVLVGEKIADAATRSASKDNFKASTVKLEKGQSVFYVDPATAKREQLSAVVEALEVEVPYSSSATVPDRTAGRRMPTMKLD